MRVRFVEGAGTIEGSLYYVERESSFAFEEREAGGSRRRHPTATIVLGTLEIDVSLETRRLLDAEGYCPRQSWHHAKLKPPLAREVGLALEGDVPLDSHTGLRLAGVGSWPVEFDGTNGWIRIARDDKADEEAAEIASDVVVGTVEGTIHSLWLKPRFVENYPR